jgi:glycine cleavage system H protein
LLTGRATHGYNRHIHVESAAHVAAAEGASLMRWLSALAKLSGFRETWSLRNSERRAAGPPQSAQQPAVRFFYFLTALLVYPVVSGRTVHMAALKTPADLLYLRTDEWIRIEGDSATIGITDYAQDALNDIVFVELPEVGKTFKAGEVFGVVESVKAASDLVMPLGGTVTEVNLQLKKRPDDVNADPYGEGWFIRVTLTETENSALLNAQDYEAYNAQR